MTHSEGYEVRSKIHKVASYATLPLFVAQYIVGQELYDGNGSESAKSAHGALVIGMATLFAVNTVTGVWNLWDDRHETQGRTRRWTHGLMMLAASAGFVATGATAPDDDDDGGGVTSSDQVDAPQPGDWLDGDRRRQLPVHVLHALIRGT